MRAVSFMDPRLTPEFFSGSAIAALCGLLSGLLLHAAWEQRPGGPQILAGAAAAAPSRPGVDGQPAEPVGLADLDTGHVTPAPLPVTRLAPQMFDLQPAGIGEPERQDAGDLVAGVAPLAPRESSTSP